MIKQRGFTLIEMVLAVGVMAIVIVAINAVFFSAVRLRTRTADQLDAAAPVEQAVTMLRRDLQSAMAPGGILAGDFKAGGVNEPNLNQPAALEIFTTTGALHDNEPWADIQKVTYELLPAAGGGKELFRSVTRNLLNTVSPTVDDQWLLSDVQDFQVSCYDGTQWLDTWDTTAGNTNLPVAVRIRIQLAGNSQLEPVELVVPIVMQTRTNQLTTVATTGR